MASFDGSKLKKMMDKQRLKLSVAESLTCGNIQAMIGATSGASTFFEGGITTYNLKQKVEQLSVNEEHARQVNSVSERVAIEMARGVSVRFNTHIGIGTTGYAEPYPDEQVLFPYAHFAIWRRILITDEGEVVVRQLVRGDGLDRVGMQRHLAEKALVTLVEYLDTIYGTP